MVEGEVTERARIEREIGLASDSCDPFAAMVRATRMPMVITDPSRSDNPIVFCNDAFINLTGYPREEIVGRNCNFLQGDGTDRSALQAIRVALNACVPIELDLLNYKRSGEAFWNRLLVAPVFDAEGRLTYFFASQQDVTLEKEHLVRLRHDRDELEREVERRSDELLRNEDQLRFIVEAGRFGLWTLDLADMRLETSDVCRWNYGREPDEALTYDDLVSAVVPEHRDTMRRAMRESIEAGTDYDVEYAVETRAGERRWIQVRGRTSYGPDGEPLTMAGVSIDVTERKRGEEHRAMLAGELDHRVKNSMAIIQAICHQTLRTAGSLEDARETLDARLRSLARAHDVFTGDNWAEVSMAEVVARALEPFRDGPGARFECGGPYVRLTPRLALAFVLALHELSTNAVKYGALSNDDGRVVLRWAVEDGATLKMTWQEFGGPPVSKPTRRGFGSKLIERALASELGGSATIDYRPDGIVFAVTAPLPDPSGKRS